MEIMKKISSFQGLKEREERVNRWMEHRGFLGNGTIVYDIIMVAM